MTERLLRVRSGSYDCHHEMFWEHFNFAAPGNMFSITNIKLRYNVARSKDYANYFYIKIKMSSCNLLDVYVVINMNHEDCSVTYNGQ